MPQKPYSRTNERGVGYLARRLDMRPTTTLMLQLSECYMATGTNPLTETLLTTLRFLSKAFADIRLYLTTCRIVSQHSAGPVHKSWVRR